MNKIITRIKWLKYKYRSFKKKHSHAGKVEAFMRDFCNAYLSKVQESKKENLLKLAKETGCTYETASTGGTYMSWASPEYREYYNRYVVDKTINNIRQFGISDVEFTKKGPRILCQRPGLVIGYKGEMIQDLEKRMGIKFRVKDFETPVESAIAGLSYAYCVNDWEDLL